MSPKTKFASIALSHPPRVDIRLSWDLFIVVFFGIVIAYSFIIGRNSTLKVIISSYMAILCADGVGNLLNNYVLPNLTGLNASQGDQALILLKIFIFVLVIVILAIKGGFFVDVLEDQAISTRLIATTAFGFLNGGLIVSTILVYVSGGSFVAGTLDVAKSTNIYLESELVQLMINNYDLWFALPAIAIVVVSFFEAKTTIE